MRKKTVIPDTPVRIKILNELIKKSYPLHFSEIRELVHKQDAVIGRELKTLVEAGLVIKDPKGLYSINTDSKENHDILTQLALKSGSDTFHYIMDSMNIHVFMACEEIDKGLIEVNDFYNYIENDTAERFINTVQELFSIKLFSVILKEMDRGNLPKKKIPVQKIKPYFMKPCKIMVTYNLPFFKPVYVEKK
ncbi:MAG: winged helix-turn-helix domain-containing protein [Euryarchaeota archaeon]|nr:winged helix-turn-helix domain-containing protein [Euryarchaeota archaeon]MBU4222156.1 winged helix-turn-helix domain-containing protein [Euryarchaeota archaeon]MCG2735298.1 winged helix-turn-helix domain-containing protein [Candidatus Methanoperedenaceae archaeon]